MHVYIYTPKVSNMDDPNDLCVCASTSEIFVADCRTDRENAIGCMWKVTPSGKFTRWLLRGGLSPYSLSIRNDRVLITPLNSRLLLIFNTEQKLKKKIALPARMEPRHAVETDHNTVVVCLWGRRDGAKVFKLAEFDDTGKQLRMFLATDALNDLPHAFVDTSSGKVLVVDSWNSNVILLSNNLELERVLVNHLDNNPYRIFYEQQTGHLFIGESVENIKVYSVSYPPNTADHIQ